VILELSHNGSSADIVLFCVAQLLVCVVSFLPLVMCSLPIIKPRKMCSTDDDVMRLRRFFMDPQNFLEYEEFMISEGTVHQLLFRRQRNSTNAIGEDHRLKAFDGVHRTLPRGFCLRELKNSYPNYVHEPHRVCICRQFRPVKGDKCGQDFHASTNFQGISSTKRVRKFSK
jgi:hypothetical protein